MKDLVTNLDSRAPAAPAQAFLQAADYSAYGTKGDVPAGGFIPAAAPEGITLRDAFSGKEDQGPDFSLPWLDFGARAYSPALRRWMTPDPLGEKYPAVNPYAYCAGDPVNYVDPTGESHYKVDDEGNIVLVESTEDDFDVLYINFSEIGPNQSYKVNDTSLLKSLASDDSQQKSKDNKQAPRVSSATSANLKEVAGLFKFLADNTSVEWVIHASGNEYTLGTIHKNDSAGSWMDYELLQKPQWSIHSHPGIKYIDKQEAKESMGYDHYVDGKISPWGDWGVVLDDYYDNNCNETKIRQSFVYFPASKRIYQVGIYRPLFIRTWK